jgi:hypothetical protein
MRAVLGVAAALLLMIGPEELQRALTIGGGTAAERGRFHARYTFAGNDPTIQTIEVLTEFRRVVVAAEDHILHGDHMFSARQASVLTAPWRGKVTIVVRARFHPQNVYMSVPSYRIEVGPLALAPLDVRLTPEFMQAAPNQRSGTVTPLVGGLVEADFDVNEIGQSTQVVRVTLDKKQLARVTIDFSRLE